MGAREKREQGERKERGGSGSFKRVGIGRKKQNANFSHLSSVKILTKTTTHNVTVVFI